MKANMQLQIAAIQDYVRNIGKEPVEAIAARHGVSDNGLRYWVRKFQNGGYHLVATPERGERVKPEDVVVGDKEKRAVARLRKKGLI